MSDSPIKTNDYSREIWWQNKLVGFFTLSDNFSNLSHVPHRSPRFTLKDIYLYKKYTGNGIGRKVIEYLKFFQVQIHFSTAKTNTRGIDFYKNKCACIEVSQTNSLIHLRIN